MFQTIIHVLFGQIEDGEEAENDDYLGNTDAEFQEIEIGELVQIFTVCLSLVIQMSF